MSPRNTRVLVFATALLMAPLLPGWAQAPTHPRPQPKKAEGEGGKPPPQKAEAAARPAREARRE